MNTKLQQQKQTHEQQVNEETNKDEAKSFQVI
jgi:hypothetical protein